MWETNKGTTERDKRTIKRDVGIAQCEDGNRQMWEKSKGTTQHEKRIVTSDVGTVKCKKKVREPPNVTKELSYMMLELHNVRMKPSSVRKR